MKAKSDILAGIMEAVGALRLLEIVPKSNLFISNYHRIYDGELHTLFDRGVFAHSKDAFYAQIKWIKKRFRILSEAEIIDIVEKKENITTQCCAITFDDGYKDNYDIAYPILKDLEVPAIFFIPIDAIESRKLGWWDLIAYLIGKTTKETIKIHDFEMELKTEGKREDSIRKVQRIFKDTPYEAVRNLVSELSEAAEVELPGDEIQTRELMSWAEIQELSENNIAIGSHTKSHRILAQLSREEQLDELAVSKAFLEEKIRKPVNTIAYPVGGANAYNEETKAIAQEAGYRAAFSFTSEINRWPIKDCYDIRRAEYSNYFPLFKAQVLLPYVFLR